MNAIYYVFYIKFRVGHSFMLCVFKKFDIERLLCKQLYHADLRFECIVLWGRRPQIVHVSICLVLRVVYILNRIRVL